MDRVYKREVETGCEYTLPDYMGDIKRVLYSGARFVPTGRFLQDGRAMLSGILNYDVTYVDSDGRLTAFEASSDVDISEDICSDSDCDAMMTAIPAQLGVRVVGPRKMSLKSKLLATVVISGSDEVKTSGAIEEEREDVEMLRDSVTVLSSKIYTSGEREYAQEAERLVGITNEEIDIISTSGKVYVTEAVAEDGAVRVKGEIVISSIVKTPLQPPFVIGKVIPFDESISIEGAVAEDEVFADAYLTSKVMGVAEDGDATTLTANAICEFSVLLSKNKNIDIIKDAYLIGGECKSEYEEMHYSELACTARAKESVAFSVPRSELGIANAREVLLADVSPLVQGCKKGENSLTLEGVAHISGFACEISAEDEIIYTPFKAEAPFAVNVPLDAKISEAQDARCVVSAGACNVSLDSDRISLNYDLYCYVRVEEDKTATRLCSCIPEEGKGETGRLSEIVVYYPDPDETLYSVSKLHRRRMCEVAAVNGIAATASALGEETLGALGVKHLIIP